MIRVHSTPSAEFRQHAQAVGARDTIPLCDTRRMRRVLLLRLINSLDDGDHQRERRLIQQLAAVGIRVVIARGWRLGRRRR